MNGVSKQMVTTARVRQCHTQVKLIIWVLAFLMTDFNAENLTEEHKTRQYIFRGATRY